MTTSTEAFAAAREVIPGGVNSPVRAFAGVGGTPVFIERAEGPYMYDIEGNRYIDYVGSWGPMITGHANPKVLDAVKRQVDNGLSFGAPTELETEMARLVIDLVPSAEMVRMTSSGTEAVMSAIRLARGFTGRNKVVKFSGGYHGHVDALLVKAGSGALTLGIPNSPGIPEGLANLTLTAQYNNLEEVRQIFAESGEEIAAVIVEPVAGNMGCVPPIPGFLHGLRELTADAGALLIFDEVMTGFRVNRACAQGMYNITPDLTTLGKILGGGLPVGAVAGREDVMLHLAPMGPVYQAGTLSGNPIAMASGLATLRQVAEDGFHQRLAAATHRLCMGMDQAAKNAGVPMVINQVPAMFGIFFTDAPHVISFEDVDDCDSERYAKVFHGLLERGVYLAPSAYEAGFLSITHDEATIDSTVTAFAQVLSTL